MVTPLRLSLIGLLSFTLAQAVSASECATDTSHGAQVFAAECGVCHAVSKGTTGMMGPNLAGVYGRKSGSLAGFSYSQAMRDKDVTWQADNITQLAWVADRTGAIGWYNQRWYDYTGLAEGESNGWGWDKVHHPDHLERVTAHFKASIAAGEEWRSVFDARPRLEARAVSIVQPEMDAMRPRGVRCR